MLRTGLLAGLVATVIAGGVVQWSGARPHRYDLMLVYVGADDCAPCRLWQRDVVTSFRATPRFRHIVYR
jgi:hypothetical protein